jgi:hypothetical protein
MIEEKGMVAGLVGDLDETSCTRKYTVGEEWRIWV